MQEIVTGTIDQITGSISSGTTLSRDLIPAFLDALRDLDATAAQALEKEYCEVLGNIGDDDCIQEYDVLGLAIDEDAMYLYDALYDALNELAPPFHYFGTHEGNGADFGFWICDESIRESLDNATATTFFHRKAKATLGTEYYINLDDGMLWHVNDHGNVTGWTLSGVLDTTPIVEVV
jgi:hypothetical protein